MAKMTAKDRELLIDGLVENQLVTEEDRESLEGMSDVALFNFGQSLVANDEADDDDEEADDEEVDDVDGDEEDNDDVTPARNSARGECTCNKCGGMKKHKKGKMDEEEPTGNSAPVDAAEWLENAPAEIQEIFLNARQVNNEAKASVIQKLTANLSKDVQKAEAKRLARLPLPELQSQLKIAESFAANKSSSPQKKGGGNFSVGSGGSPTGNTRSSKPNVEGSEPLVPPTINWKEVVDELDASR